MHRRRFTLVGDVLDKIADLSTTNVGEQPVPEKRRQLLANDPLLLGPPLVPPLGHVDVLARKIAEGLHLAAFQLLQRRIVAAGDVAHDDPRPAARIRERQRGVRTERHPTQSSVHAVAHDERLLAAVRHAQAEAAHRQIPMITLALLKRRDWQRGDSPIGQSVSHRSAF